MRSWIILFCLLPGASADEASAPPKGEKAPIKDMVDPFEGSPSSEAGCWRCNLSTHELMLDAYVDLCNVTMSPMRPHLKENYWTRTLEVRALREKLIEYQSECLKITKRLRRDLTVEERLADLKGPYTKWLGRNGISTDGFEFGMSGDKGIGVFLTKNISYAGWLVGIGHNITLTTLDALADPVVLSYWSIDEWLRNRSDVQLMLHLVRERSKEMDSKLDYLINALPDTFDTPLYWSTDDLAKLEGTSAYQPALLSNSGPIFDYCRMHWQFPEPGDCKEVTPYTKAKKILGIGLEDFLWSWSIVQSRVEQSNGTMALVPVMDFINAAADTTSFVHTTEHAYYYTVDGGLEEGKELFRHYGNRSSHDVLVNLGFVPENGSSFDKVLLQVDMKRDRFFRPKLQALHSVGTLPSGGDPAGDAFYRAALDNEGVPSQQLWAIARVLSSESIKAVKGMKAEWLHTAPSTGHKEAKAAKWLLKRVRDAQKKMPKQAGSCEGASSAACSVLRLAKLENAVLERAATWAKDFAEEQAKLADDKGEDQDEDDDASDDAKDEL